MPAEFGRYLVDKGSITVDGVSLTVVEAKDESFTVSLIPETLARTTLGTRRPGDRVNLEVDVIAKHVEKLLVGGYLRQPLRTRTTHDRLDPPRHHRRRRRRALRPRGRGQPVRARQRDLRDAPHRLGLAGRPGRQRPALHRLRHRRDERRQARAAVGPGRPPGLLRRGQPLRLVALVPVARGRRRGRRRRDHAPLGDRARAGQLVVLGVVGYARGVRRPHPDRLVGPADRGLDPGGLDARDLRHGPRLGRVLAGVDPRRHRRRDHTRPGRATTRRPACTSSTPSSS